MKTAVIFDLDGTLLNTTQDLLDAANCVLSRNGFPVQTLPELRKAVGNGAANMIRRLLPQGTQEETVQKVLSDYLPYYAAHCRDKTVPYGGIPQALEELKNRYVLAIVSNKPDRAVKELCRHFFQGVYAMGETPGCPRKPAPDMIYHAMAFLGTEKCIYVGDSEEDIAAAANAGLPCVSVTWGFREEAELIAAGGSVLCSSPDELAACIRKAERSQYGQ